MKKELKKFMDKQITFSKFNISGNEKYEYEIVLKKISADMNVVVWYLFKI